MDSKQLKDIIKDEDITAGIEKQAEDRFALQRMAEKLREICGDKYVFVLFDAKYPPKVGDTLEVGNLLATFKKKIIK
jgi:hypothetical protein